VPQVSLAQGNFDAILLPGFWSESANLNDLAQDAHQQLVAGLKALKPQTQIWAYCSSVSLLAKAGKLKNRQATSTWWLVQYLQTHYPDIDWRFSKAYVFDQNIATASGVNGYLPIAQQLIEKTCGERVLKDVIDLMVMPRPEYETTPLKALKLIKLDNALAQKLYLWVEKTPAQQISVLAAANHLNLSERTFSRKIKAITQMSCSHFMRQIKLNQASELLVYHSTAVNVISERLGYADDATFRRLFKAVTNYTPSQYRQQFKR
jgi:transcriptional regulator GlxA family with amidase domain